MTADDKLGNLEVTGCPQPCRCDECSHYICRFSPSSCNLLQMRRGNVLPETVNTKGRKAARSPPRGSHWTPTPPCGATTVVRHYPWGSRCLLCTQPGPEAPIARRWFNLCFEDRETEAGRLRDFPQIKWREEDFDFKARSPCAALTLSSAGTRPPSHPPVGAAGGGAGLKEKHRVVALGRKPAKAQSEKTKQ